MRNAAWWRLVAVVALLTACGPSNPNAAVTSPSPAASPSGTPAPTSSPAPAPGACDSTHRCLALVTLRTGGHTVVRDVTDVDHAYTVADLGTADVRSFASGTLVSYVDAGKLLVGPLNGSSPTTVASDSEIALFAWGADGKAAYVADSGNGMTLHQVTGGKDTVLATGIPSIPAVGCESEFCAGADSWDLSLAYSPDASALSLVVALPSRNVFRVWSADGKVLDASDNDGRFMATWSGDRLFYRDDKTGVLVWRNGYVSRFMNSSQWIHPQASPAGGEIVYSTRDRQGLHRVYVVDTATAQWKLIRTGRSDPRYLTSRYVWYRGERACVASDRCPAGWNFVDSGKTYIYDLQTGAEYPSIITNVFDTWPHAA